jgi:hypothetical protein
MPPRNFTACALEPTPRRRPGRAGSKLAVLLTGGNRNDVTQLPPLLDVIPPVRGRSAIPADQVRTPRHRARHHLPPHSPGREHLLEDALQLGAVLRGDTRQPAAAGLTDIDTTQAITYYRIERGGNEHSTNRRLSRSDSLLLGYDAFHLVDQLMTQPLQVILAGRIGNTGSYEAGMQLWKMAPNPVDLMVIEGAGHYEMYDEPAYVDAAVERLADFYVNNL